MIARWRTSKGLFIRFCNRNLFMRSLFIVYHCEALFCISQGGTYIGLMCARNFFYFSCSCRISSGNATFCNAQNKIIYIYTYIYVLMHHGESKPDNNAPLLLLLWTLAISQLNHQIVWLWLFWCHQRDQHQIYTY